MRLQNLFTNGVKLVKSNSPEILTAVGVSGVVTTAYLTGKASFRASEMIHEDESKGGTAGDIKQRFKERTKLVWKCYISAGISGVLTVGAIIGSSKATGRRTAAAVTAYSIGEKAFSEYKEKVIEQIGKGKEKKIRDDIAQEHVDKGPVGSREVIILGNGTVLCCELHTHRYFRSDMEMLRKAQNDINVKVVNERYVTLDEFYDIIGLPYTSGAGNMGWNSDRLMELQFSTVLSEDGEPCLAFEYNYLKPIK